ncbi:U3 small nucleolar RNA-associated protein 4 [Grifola frondosa]|uniref:U3 small nucleolar RNA-associated protein 4 n=1 Tax=Grifola frondosa TaxID=5627 RepID=A0A1C7MS00_GRIFR|nr:U3 small nucleolar RNA-associated protein 4 [Grifola frondosa]
MVETTTVSVHRCRFVDFTPSAITALCFPPLPLPSVKGKKKVASKKTIKFGTLAVGRANGNIELCEWTGSNAKTQAWQAWVVKKTLSGPCPSKVESLAFTIRFPDSEDEVPSWSNLRLFSAGGGSELAEWDIERGCIKRTISSQGGTIWSVSPNPASTLLALGCEDGSVRLLSLQHDGLTHLRRLDRIKSRILSIAWGPPVPRQTTSDRTQNASSDSDDDDDDEDNWTDSWLVTGCSDSSLRKWDIATGRVLDRMGTDKIRGERTLVWTVGVLGDGTVVSGDSMGMVKFWDSRTCTQTQSFQGHGADVLCLTVSPEGNAVYTSGVDQKVTQFSHVKTSRPENASLLSRPSGHWVQSCSRRLHSHDVRALAIWPPHTPLPSAYKRHFAVDVAPVLASGAWTCPWCTAATYEDSYHRRMAYSSGPYSTSAVHLARQARLLLCTRDSGLTVWRILRRQPSDDEDAEDLDSPSREGGWERVLDMDLNVQTNIVAGAISDNGRWVAVSDWYETKLFELVEEKNGDLKPKRIRDFASIIHGHLSGSSSSTGSSSLTFTPDSSKLVLATSASSRVVIVELGSGDRSSRVLRVFEQHRMRDGLVRDRVIRGRKGDEDAQIENAATVMSDDDFDSVETVKTTITRMAVSADGQWLATSDDLCRTHVFNLDSVQHHCVLPSFPQAIHVLTFDPATPNTLVLGLANNAIEIYDVELRQFPRWSRALPQRFTHLHDPLLGVTFNPAPRTGEQKGSSAGAPLKQALFWGATWLCRMRLSDRPSWSGFDKRKYRKGNGAPPAGPNGKIEVSLEEGQQQQENSFRMVTQYRPVLFVDYLAPGELVVVERPLVDVLAKLPPAYFKPKYGAS